MSFHVPEYARITGGPLASTKESGNNGAFVVITPSKAVRVIASDGAGWEHVSVSMPQRSRIPTWEIMCFIKDTFWDAEDCVIQYHPPKSEYVNNCENCLHLWRSTDKEMPRPPSILVGIK